jgi:addiction module HigA family antidote
MPAKKMPPVHPGEILLEEYLRPLGISQNKLGRDLGVPAQRINEIVRGQRAITVDSALRLAKYFNTTPQFWLNLQSHYDLEMAKEMHLTDRIAKEVRTAAIGKKSYHVVPAETGGWRILENDKSQSARIFSRKEEAITLAREICRSAGVEIFIHNLNGKISRDECVVKDTCPPKRGSLVRKVKEKKKIHRD